MYGFIISQGGIDSIFKLTECCATLFVDKQIYDDKYKYVVNVIISVIILSVILYKMYCKKYSNVKEVLKQDSINNDQVLNGQNYACISVSYSDPTDLNSGSISVRKVFTSIFDAYNYSKTLNEETFIRPIGEWLQVTN